MESCNDETTHQPTQVKKKGRALLIYDLKQPKLISTKILFFAIASSIGVLLPYMTIHMKSLGITVEETATIYGVYPLFTILSPYTMGMIADKLGNFKVLLSIAMLLAMTNGLLFLAIPTGRFIDKYPANLSMAVGCSDDGTLVLTDLDSKSCGLRSSSSPGNLSLTVTECGYVCYDEIHPRSHLDKEADNSLPADWPAVDQPYKKYRHAIFFRDIWGLDVTCGAGGNCSLNRNQWLLSNNRNTTFTQVTLRLNNSDGSFPVERMLLNGVQPLKDNLQCNNYDQPVKLIQPMVFVLNSTLKFDEGTLERWTGEEEAENRIVYKTCRPQCIVQTQRKQLCSDDAFVVVFNPQLTFWLYLLLRIFFSILLSGVVVLYEGACLAIIVQYKGDLGLQRMFGIMGTMIFSPISGALIDYFSVNKNIPDFRPAFYLYAVFFGLASLGMLTIDLDFKPPAKELLKDMKSVLKNVELIFFFFVIFSAGLFWGYIESYLFWFLEEMGGTKSLMGLTVTISSLSGIPTLLFSDAIFRRIGHNNVQIIGFVFYIIRLVGYSYIYDPYMCLIYEAMEGITTSLMLTSAISYSSQLSKPTTLATVQGMVIGTYYGIGRGAGSLVGGFIMKAYGTRVTFRILGVAAFFVGLLYFFFTYFYIRRRRLNQERDEKKINPPQDGLVNPVFVPDDNQKSARKGKSID